MVLPPAFNAPKCAKRSMPLAIPLTTVTLFLAAVSPILMAVVLPYSLHLREPTTARFLPESNLTSPIQYNASGGSEIFFRSSGYALSSFFIILIFSFLFIIMFILFAQNSFFCILRVKKPGVSQCRSQVKNLYIPASL